MDLVGINDKIDSTLDYIAASFETLAECAEDVLKGDIKKNGQQVLDFITSDDTVMSVKNTIIKPRTAITNYLRTKRVRDFEENGMEVLQKHLEGFEQDYDIKITDDPVNIKNAYIIKPETISDRDSQYHRGFKEDYAACATVKKDMELEIVVYQRDTSFGMDSLVKEWNARFGEGKAKIIKGD